MHSGKSFLSPWGCHLLQICSGTDSFRTMLCFLSELAEVFSWRDDQSLREAAVGHRSQSYTVLTVTAASRQSLRLVHTVTSSCSGWGQQREPTFRQACTVCHACLSGAELRLCRGPSCRFSHTEWHGDWNGQSGVLLCGLSRWLMLYLPTFHWQECAFYLSGEVGTCSKQIPMATALLSCGWDSCRWAPL